MRPCTTLLLGLLSGCATPAGSPTPTPSPGLEALAARELAPLSRQRVSAPDGSFTGEVEAAGAPTFQEQPGVLVLSVPLGTRGPLTCFFYPPPLGAGDALLRLVRLAGRRTELEGVRITDVRLIGDSPAVYAEARYRVDMPGGKAAGLAKMMVYAHGQVPLACAHDEPGYAESFKRMTSGLAGSLESVDGKPPAPRYFEFSLLRVRGQPMGFEKRVMREAAGGARWTEVETSVFLPRPPSALRVQDTLSTERAGPDGELVARGYSRSTDGEPDLQMTLAQVKGREYHYEGTHGGKALRGTFTAPAELATEPGTARLVREHLPPGGELLLHFYSPEANPVAPVRQVLRKEAAGSRELTLEMGPLKGTLTVDAQGMVEKAVLPLGHLEVVRERVHVSGTP